MLSNIFLLVISIFAILAGISLFFLLWNKPVLVIYIQLIYCCFMRFFIYHLHFPEVIKFFSDYLTILLFIQVILQINKTKTLNIRKPLFFIGLYLLTAIFSTLINASSILFFFLGLRPYFKLFLFFFACAIFLKRNDLDKLMKFLLAILPVNTLIVFFQYFFMGLRDDYIGGLFGTQKGCNIELNIFLTVISIIAIVYYVSNKINLVHCLASILQVSVIAALSELKIIYVALLLILLFVFILTYPNKRAIVVSISCFLIIFFGIIIFLIIYPYWSKMITDFGAFVRESMGGTYGEEMTLGRTVAGPYVFQNILLKPTQKMFGIGLGYADRYLSMQSNFFNRYEQLAYFYFAYVIILLEIGIIGLIIFCMFYLSIIYESLRIKRLLIADYAFYCYISLIVSIFIFQLILYDQSIFYDGAYMLFFTLSLPFVMEKDAYESGTIIIRKKYETY